MVTTNACEHGSMVFFLTHYNMVLMVAERERPTWGSMANLVAIKYFEQRRRSWARRIRRGDPMVQIMAQLEEEARKINEPIVTLVKTELQAKAQEASSNRVQQQAAPEASSSNGESGMIMESLLSKQNAAVDALTRRSQEATRQLSRQQENFMNRTEQLLSFGK